MNKRLKRAVIKSAQSMARSLPILLGVILLLSLAEAVIPKAVYSSFFRGNIVLDSLIGTTMGSILAGNPVTSYIIGGELLSQGIDLLPVTSFLVAWVTVGIVQFPAEAALI
jgi:hypothetical protein